jgi:hypothetical protein
MAEFQEETREGPAAPLKVKGFQMGGGIKLTRTIRTSNQTKSILSLMVCIP